MAKMPKTKIARSKVSSSRVVRVELKSGTVRSFRAPNKRSLKAIRRYADKETVAM